MNSGGWAACSSERGEQQSSRRCGGDCEEACAEVDEVDVRGLYDCGCRTHLPPLLQVNATDARACVVKRAFICRKKQLFLNVTKWGKTQNDASTMVLSTRVRTRVPH